MKDDSGVLDLAGSSSNFASLLSRRYADSTAELPLEKVHGLFVIAVKRETRRSLVLDRDFEKHVKSIWTLGQMSCRTSPASSKHP